MSVWQIKNSVILSLKDLEDYPLVGVWRTPASSSESRNIVFTLFSKRWESLKRSLKQRLNWMNDFLKKCISQFQFCFCLDYGRGEKASWKGYYQNLLYSDSDNWTKWMTMASEDKRGFRKTNSSPASSDKNKKIKVSSGKKNACENILCSCPVRLFSVSIPLKSQLDFYDFWMIY